MYLLGLGSGNSVEKEPDRLAPITRFCSWGSSMIIYYSVLSTPLISSSSTGTAGLSSCRSKTLTLSLLPLSLDHQKAAKVVSATSILLL